MFATQPWVVPNPALESSGDEKNVPLLQVVVIGGCSTASMQNLALLCLKIDQCQLHPLQQCKNCRGTINLVFFGAETTNAIIWCHFLLARSPYLLQQMGIV